MRRKFLAAVGALALSAGFVVSAGTATADVTNPNHGDYYEKQLQDEGYSNVQCEKTEEGSFSSEIVRPHTPEGHEEPQGEEWFADGQQYLLVVVKAGGNEDGRTIVKNPATDAVVLAPPVGKGNNPDLSHYIVCVGDESEEELVDVCHDLGDGEYEFLSGVKKSDHTGSEHENDKFDVDSEKDCPEITVEPLFLEICHATSSVANPYNFIEVPVSAVDGEKVNDHSSHEGPVFNVSMQPGDKWGDIIPPVEDIDGLENGLNWDAEGIAVYDADCEVTPATTPPATTPPATTPPATTPPATTPPSEAPNEAPSSAPEKEANQAPKQEEEVTGGNTEPLAKTGSDATWAAMLAGVAALGAGLALTLAARRREAAE